MESLRLLRRCLEIEGPSRRNILARVSRNLRVVADGLRRDVEVL